VKHWYTWISNTTSITGNVSPVILVVFDIHVYQYLTSYTCSVRYSCISMFHQLYLYCLIFMYINVSPVILVVYTWISNTTCTTGETLIYMNIKHYKYNWWNIDIHEYQALQVYLVKHCTRYTFRVWYSCIAMFHQLYL
jgi:hypothetical protein